MMFKKPSAATFALMLLLPLGAVTLSGCEEDGSMEEAGEELDEATNDLGRDIEDATD